MQCHNPYFNRWFSAILVSVLTIIKIKRHNPYFNRWFSAIDIPKILNGKVMTSQSLF